MPSTIVYHFNKTQGAEHIVPCVKCIGKTTHKVLASVDVRGDNGDSNFFVSWADDHQVIQCLGCKSVSFRIESSNSEDYYPIDNEGNYEYDLEEKLYPSRLEGAKGLGNEAHYLPASVRRIYDETLIALSNRAPVLAGIGLRAMLETVCKGKKCYRRRPFQKDR